MTAKQFQTLVGECVSTSDLTEAIDKLSEITGKLTEVEKQIFDWEATHDMAAPGHLLREHAELKAQRSKAMTERDRVRAALRSSKWGQH